MRCLYFSKPPLPPFAPACCLALHHAPWCRHARAARLTRTHTTNHTTSHAAADCSLTRSLSHTRAPKLLKVPPHSAPPLPHGREALRMRAVRLQRRTEEAGDGASPHALGRAAVPLQHVQLPRRAKVHAHCAHPCAHGREALCVQPVSAAHHPSRTNPPPCLRHARGWRERA